MRFTMRFASCSYYRSMNVEEKWDIIFNPHHLVLLVQGSSGPSWAGQGPGPSNPQVDDQGLEEARGTKRKAPDVNPKLEEPVHKVCP